MAAFELNKSNESETDNKQEWKSKNKKLNNTDIHFSLKKLSYKKNDLNTVKVIFFYVIGCLNVVYNFTLLTSSFKIFYIPNEPPVFMKRIL